MVPVGELGGEDLNACSIWWLLGILMERGFDILTGEDGNSTFWIRSLTSTKDWKYNRILVLGKRIEHLKERAF
jgi:hypothetical protein